jgi:hypothetical protein
MVETNKEADMEKKVGLSLRFSEEEYNWALSPFTSRRGRKQIFLLGGLVGHLIRQMGQDPDYILYLLANGNYEAAAKILTQIFSTSETPAIPGIPPAPKSSETSAASKPATEKEAGASDTNDNTIDLSNIDF